MLILIMWITSSDLADYAVAYEEFSTHVKKAIVIYGEDEEARHAGAFGSGAALLVWRKRRK